MKDSADLSPSTTTFAIVPTIEEEGHGEEEALLSPGRRLEAAEYAAMQHVQELMVEVGGEVV